jgi:hypothetical protein
MRAIFEIVFIAVFILYLMQKASSNHLMMKKIFLIIIGFLIPWFFTLIYFYTNGSFNDFHKAVFQFNESHSIILRNDTLGFVFVHNTLFVRTILLVIFVLIIFYLYKKREISKHVSLFLIWAISSIYALLITQTPSTHYLLQGIIPFAVLTSLIIRKFLHEPNILKRIEFIALYAVTMLAILNLFTSGRSLQTNTPTIRYYLNFSRYLTGKIDVTTYSAFFGKNTNSLYRLNNYLADLYPKQKHIYVWTDNPWIYDIADLDIQTRYIKSSDAKEHLGEVKSSFTKNMPFMIIIDENAVSSDELVEFINQSGFEREKVLDNYTLYTKATTPEGV